MRVNGKIDPGSYLRVDGKTYSFDELVQRLSSRCDTCTYWGPYHESLGACRYATYGGLKMWAESAETAWLNTTADFGCVQWEKK